MQRRTLLAQLGIGITGTTALEKLTGSREKSKKSNQSRDEPRKTKQTPGTPETHKENLTVELLETDPVFEGHSVTIKFAVSNCHGVALTERVTLERDSWTTVFDEKITVEANSIDVFETTWRVRPDAGGHAMTLHLSGASDTDKMVVSGRSRFSPVIKSVKKADGSSNKVTVTYTVENTGSSPGTHTVTVLVNGVPHKTHDVYAGIGQGHHNEYTYVFDPSDEIVVVSVKTESSTATKKTTV